MGKYQEAAKFYGEDAEFHAKEYEQDKDLLLDGEYNSGVIDPLAEASEQQDAITIDNINWDIPEEVINEAYADAYKKKAQAEDMQIWISEHPAEAVKILATHLDSMADNYQHSQAGRYARIAATEAHKLHWLIIGSDEAINELNEVPGW